MRGWLAIPLVLVLLLSGCASKAPDGTGTTSGTSTASGTATKTTTSGTTTATGSATSTGTSTTTSPPASANHAPTAALVAKAGNGTAALNVTFTLSGHDADGDALTWTLAYGDGNRTLGAKLPSNLTRAYAKAGTYNVTLTVTDGKNATTAQARVNLTAPGGGAAGGGAPQVVSGEWPLGLDGCLSPEHLPMQDGLQYLEITVEARTVGLPWTATIEATVPAIFYGIDFFDAAGAYIADSGAFGEETTMTGTVPAGAASALLYTCGGAVMTGTYTAG